MAKPLVETAEHRKAFDLYLSLGKERSCLAVSREFSVSEQSVKNWSSAFLWQKRVEDAEKRIADKASSQVESALVKHQNQMISIADKMVKLFLHQIDGAFNEDGSINTEAVEAYRPKAADVRLWAELKGEILARASGPTTTGGELPIDAQAADLMGVEVVERFIVERTSRLVTLRKRLAEGGGIV